MLSTFNVLKLKAFHFYDIKDSCLCYYRQPALNIVNTIVFRMSDNFMDMPIIQ